MQIQHTDEPLPDEEDIYGVNEINEYDADYWEPAERREAIKSVVLRVVAAVIAVSFFLWILSYVL